MGIQFRSSPSGFAHRLQLGHRIPVGGDLHRFAGPRGRD